MLTCPADTTRVIFSQQRNHHAAGVGRQQDSRGRGTRNQADEF